MKQLLKRGETLIDRKEVVARYVAGESTPQLAKVYGVNSSTILRYLRHSGVQRRSSSEGQRLAMKNYISPVTINLNLTPYQKGWIVGLLEGEGYVGVPPSTGQPTVTITNTNLPLIREISRVLGGVRYTTERPYGNQKGPSYRIFITGHRNVYAFLRLVRPHLIVKAEVADRCLEFCEQKFKFWGVEHEATLS